MVTGLQDGVTYLFSVYASNVYGISDPASVLVPPPCESQELKTCVYSVLIEVGKHMIALREGLLGWGGGGGG